MLRQASARKTNIYLSPEDDLRISLIRSATGLPSDAAAIRYALRNVTVRRKK